MPRRTSKQLENWEVALIKMMLVQNNFNKQEILAHFSRPNRSINPARIDEIGKRQSHNDVEPASLESLEEFLETWPNIDIETGLHIKGNELLIKAREAMIAGIHVYNGANLTFRTELFIVAAIISWTYLFHCWFSKKGIDFRYFNRDGTVKVTKDGADCYWDLSECLKKQAGLISKGAAKNLRFLIGLRNEIEHRSTNRIDSRIIDKLQACCINFNKAIKDSFGAKCGIQRRLPIALQLTSFSSEQRASLKKASDLPRNIESYITAFEHGLSEEEMDDPSYQYHVAFVRMYKNRENGTDEVVHFVGGEFEEDEATQVYIRRVEENRYTATGICKKMQKKGFTEFNISAHTRLWKSLNAKDPAHGWGKQGDYKSIWVWNDNWLKEVSNHCQENKSQYCTEE